MTSEKTPLAATEAVFSSLNRATQPYILLADAHLAHEGLLGFYQRNQHPRGRHFVVHQHDHLVVGPHDHVRLRFSQSGSLNPAIMFTPWRTCITGDRIGMLPKRGFIVSGYAFHIQYKAFFYLFIFSLVFRAYLVSDIPAISLPVFRYEARNFL